jgi:hypothetical protein
MSDFASLTAELRNRLEGASTGRSVTVLEDLHSLARDRTDLPPKRSKRQSGRKTRRERS